MFDVDKGQKSKQGDVEQGGLEKAGAVANRSDSGCNSNDSGAVLALKRAWVLLTARCFPFFFLFSSFFFFLFSLLSAAEKLVKDSTTVQ